MRFSFSLFYFHFFVSRSSSMISSCSKISSGSISSSSSSSSSRSSSSWCAHVYQVDMGGRLKSLMIGLRISWPSKSSLEVVFSVSVFPSFILYSVSCSASFLRFRQTSSQLLPITALPLG
eukprot:GHVT01036455.1.p1 GENE.GHVT01036455.1~~GHVT01036455.1.p1  ORF type:complete len:120 (-),score=8.70 GHVT01036455.1:26-385(-)